MPTVNVNGAGVVDRGFWLGKWERSEPGFHQVQGNPLLKARVGRLDLKPGDRVFYGI